MSSFVGYAIFAIALIASIPLGIAMLSAAGMDISATVPGEIESYTAPNLEDYIPNTDNPISAAAGYVMWGFSSLIWIFLLVAKVALIYPILTDFFGIDPLFAAPVSAMIGIAGIFFLYKILRGQDLET